MSEANEGAVTTTASEAKLNETVNEASTEETEQPQVTAESEAATGATAGYNIEQQLMLSAATHIKKSVCQKA
jgi:hypothetical protein